MNNHTSHVVALSGGADSTCLALLLSEQKPDLSFSFVCTPTGDELPEMHNHWRTLSRLLSSPLQFLPAPTLRTLVRDHGMLPNFRARFCTPTIKILPFQKWLSDNAPAVLYVGLRADEPAREGGVYDIPGVSVSYPLREQGFTRPMVLDFLQSRGVSIPSRTDCARCFYQTLSEWWRLWSYYPEIYEDACQDELWVSTLRGKPCTYRSPSRDTRPASLVELRQLFIDGYVPVSRRGIPANQPDLFSMESRDSMCSHCAR